MGVPVSPVLQSEQSYNFPHNRQDASPVAECDQVVSLRVGDPVLQRGGRHLLALPLLDRGRQVALLLLPPRHPQDPRDPSRPRCPRHGQFGNHGSQLNFGDTDANFTGIGASVFLLVTLLMFTLVTLLGHLVPTLLEVLTTIVGAILILTAGALSITYHASLLRNQYNYNTYDAHAGMAMGVIAIVAGVLLVVDFILSVRKMKITIG